MPFSPTHSSLLHIPENFLERATLGQSPFPTNGYSPCLTKYVSLVWSFWRSNTGSSTDHSSLVVWVLYNLNLTWDRKQNCSFKARPWMDVAGLRGRSGITAAGTAGGMLVHAARILPGRWCCSFSSATFGPEPPCALSLLPFSSVEWCGGKELRQ